MAQETSVSTDRAALVALYNATDGPNWRDCSGWYSCQKPANWLSDKPIGEWSGVTTDSNGRVVNLSLNTFRLRGEIPVEVGNLSELRYLDLSDNRLSGKIPSQLGKLFELQHLNLSQTRLTGGLSGSIPTELGNLSNLRELDLADNQLSGSIPSELGNLSNLRELDLSENRLTGSIPSELGNLSELENLYLGDFFQLTTYPTIYDRLPNSHGWGDGNQLTGSIPSQLGKLSKLRHLDLADNQLTGSIPSELGNLSELENLHLDRNQLTGSIPSQLGNLSELENLYLGDNQLTGSIPSELGNLSELKNLYLGDYTRTYPPLRSSGNQLSGSIPSQLGQLSKLEFLHLGDNQLSGTIPPELGSLFKLRWLYLGVNQLTGSMPSELGNLTELQMLSVVYNGLTGSLPPELGDLSKLRWLYLSENDLSGTIPSELGNLSSLIVLNLSHNELTGTIPPELGNLPRLGQLYLSHNELTGDIPAELGNLSNLSTLRLEGNQLTECLPFSTEDRLISMRPQMAQCGEGQHWELSSSSARYQEGDTISPYLMVSLNQDAPAGGVTFTITPNYDATATAADVVRVHSSVTVAEGRHLATSYIPLVDDAVDEDDETFTVTVAANTDGWTLKDGGSDTLTVTIIDDDTAGVTITAANPLSVEEGGTATYTVVLDSQPTTNVAVTPSSGDGGAATVSPTSHTFTPSGWNTPLTFTVSGVADDDTNDETVGISHSVTSEDSKYSAVLLATVQVAVSDTTGSGQQQQEQTPQEEYADLIAQMYEWRNDPQWKEYKAHTDRWDRALLAFGEEVSDQTLTAMTAAEAQGFADRGWTRWVDVAAALRELENRAPTVSSALADATIVNESGTKGVSLSGRFSDADNDALTITAGSDDEAVATVSVAADYSTLTVSARARGTATITTTADDGNGGTVEDAFTVRVKAAPVVASAITDVTGLEEGATQDVSLSGVFSDADGDVLTVTAASSNNSVATVSSALDGSKLTMAGVAEGPATITVTAEDSDGNRVNDTFDVAVAASQPQQQQANRVPTVASTIADATIVNESGTKQVSLSGVFSDADNDALTITSASSDQTVATALAATDNSALTVTAQGKGTATITVTADDGNGGTVEDAFTVTVKAAPVLVSALDDVKGLEVGATQDVSLSKVFSDADGDALTITAVSSDEDKTTVTVAADHSSLTVVGVAEGTTTITVTAQDSDGNRVSDAFDAPVARKYNALIAQMYQWRNDPQWVSEKAHTDRWDRALLAFGETVADTTLTPMTAEEAQRFADRGWERWVDVAAALQEIEAAGQTQQQQETTNQAPTVSSALADATIVNESGTKGVSLSGTFSDADNDALTITARSDDEAVATVSVAADYSTLTVSAQSRGTATVTVTAADGNGGTVEDTFTVRVKAAPVVASSITDISGLEEGATQDVSLSGVFNDGDGDALTITAASSDENKATVTVAADGSKLTVAGVAEGTATFTVTAQDSDGNRVSDAFDVSVVAPPPQVTPNQAPTVSAAIGDAIIVHESGTKQVSLSGVFDDADGDSLTVDAASSDGAKATVSVAADYSSLTVTAQTRGTANITVTADDGNGGTVSDAFTVTVKAAPVVDSPISDISGLVARDTQDVSLSGVFSDADGDALSITAVSSDEAKATVTVATDHSSLTVEGVAEGTVTITVTAQDSDGNRVSDTFDVAVEPEPEQDPPPDEETPNRPPTVAQPLPDISLEGLQWRQFSLPDVFHDPDGDELTFTSVSSNYGVASTWVSGPTLTVLATGTGTATITVTAEDPDGNQVSDEFEVTVTPAS